MARRAMMGACRTSSVVVSVLGALLVVNAYRPVRREPLSVVSFFCGWLVGELPIQTIVVEVAGTVVFGIYGAFANWAGWVGLVLAGAGWVGLVGLAVAGHRAGRVVAEALAGASGPPLPTVEAPKPEWGRWWRLTQAVPIRARSTVVTKNVDYWGDGIRRHRLDVIARKDLDPGLERPRS